MPYWTLWVVGQHLKRTTWKRLKEVLCLKVRWCEVVGVWNCLLRNLLVANSFLNFQAVLVASRRALTERKGALNTVHEILERLEAHLKADGQFTVCTWWFFLIPCPFCSFFSLISSSQVVANMRGNSSNEVAECVLNQLSLSGLQVMFKNGSQVLSFFFLSLTDCLWFLLLCNEQGPTISPVYFTQDGKVSVDYYAIVICVPKKALYNSVKQLRAVRNPCTASCLLI